MIVYYVVPNMGHRSEFCYG